MKNQNMKVILGKEGQEVEMKIILDDGERGDFEVLVEMVHRAKNTRGRILIKAVAREGQRIMMKGKVTIEKGAEGADDFLEMRGLMLGGVIEVEPMMEILANEVKAGHAASVGRIDEEQMFYLMSRGLSRKEAEELLVKGFLEI